MNKKFWLGIEPYRLSKKNGRIAFVFACGMWRHSKPQFAYRALRNRF